MKLMRATLNSHGEWFKLQMCKDRFESLLKIDSLKEVNPPSLSTSGGILKSNSDSCTHGSSQGTKSSGARTSEDGSSPMQASSRESCDENAILKVMVNNFNLKNELLSSPVWSGFFPLCSYNLCLVEMWFSIVLLMSVFSVFMMQKFCAWVQEFLALPRADAIHLLAQYNGNAEMVIQQIFA